jgi:hypothetical protein
MNKLRRIHNYLNKHIPVPILEIRMDRYVEYYIIYRCPCGHYHYERKNHNREWLPCELTNSNAASFIMLIHDRLPNQYKKEYMAFIKSIYKRTLNHQADYSWVTSRTIQAGEALLLKPSPITTPT